MRGAGDAGIDRAEVGVEKVLVDNGFDVVVGVAGTIGADDGEFVGQLGEVRLKVAAEGDAGQSRLDLAGGAADFRRGGHLGVEGLDLARTAVQEQEDDGLVGGDRSAGRGSATGFQQPGQ